MVPLVVLALAYAADVLDQLRGERMRSERLAVESDRQRIAWELHDSAERRVHAAPLVVSALHGQVGASRPSSRWRATPRSLSAVWSASCRHTSLRTRTGSARRR